LLIGYPYATGRQRRVGALDNTAAGNCDSFGPPMFKIRLHSQLVQVVLLGREPNPDRYVTRQSRRFATRIGSGVARRALYWASSVSGTGSPDDDLRRSQPPPTAKPAPTAPLRSSRRGIAHHTIRHDHNPSTKAAMELPTSVTYRSSRHPEADST
jgi:hypothetical protein